MFRTPANARSLSLLALVAAHQPALAQPAPTQVIVERARALDAQGRHDLAADLWKQVLLLEPRDPESLTALVRFYRGAGDTTRAAQYEAALRRVQPGAIVLSGETSGGTHAEAMLQQAARLSAEHRYDDALALYRHAFGSSEPSDSWAVPYFETEAAVPASQAHAIAGLRALCAKYPANPSFQLSLARVLTYKPATRLEGIDRLAHFQGSSTQEDAARAAWKQALLWDLNSPAVRATGRQYLERYPDQQLASTLAAADVRPAKAAPSSPFEGEGYKALAAGDFARANHLFATVANQPGLAAQGEAGLGYVSLKQKDFAAAATHLERARAAGLRSPALDRSLREARFWSAMSSGNTAMQASDADTAASEFARAHAVNDSRPEATEALAGSMLADDDPARAEAVLAQDLRANPNRPDAWIGWMNAALASGQATALLERQATMPVELKTELARRPDFLALLAAAELELGNTAAVARVLARIEQLAANSGATANPDASVRAAGLLLARGYSAPAARLAAAAIRADQQNATAWQTLVAAEHAQGRDDVAIQVAMQMPHSVDAAAMQNPDFLLALASVYQAQGKLPVATRLLDHAAALPRLGDRAALSVRLQRASLTLAGGDAHGAYTQYRDVATEAPPSAEAATAEAWTGMISALHTGQHDAEALATLNAMPAALRARLQHDPAFLEIAAFVYSATRHPREAMLCLRVVRAHYDQLHQPLPFTVGTAYAWMQLNAGSDEELATTLDRLGQDPHLTAAQTSALHEIWAAWSVRRADAALQKKDGKRAVAILQTAGEAYPDQPALYAALAGMYVRTGSVDTGMKMYERMDWTHASVAQFQGAIDSAAAAHNTTYAEFWLKMALEQHPGDVTLLRLGAQLEQQRGDRKKAEAYLEAAVAQGHAPGSALEAQLLAKPGRHQPAEPLDVPADTATQSTNTDTALNTSPQAELSRLLGGSSRPAPEQSSSDAWTTSSATSAASTDGSVVLKPMAYEPAQNPFRAAAPDEAPTEPTAEPRESEPIAQPTVRWVQTAYEPGQEPAQSYDAPTPPHRRRAARPAADASADTTVAWADTPASIPTARDPLAGLGLDPVPSRQPTPRPVPARTSAATADTLDSILREDDAAPAVASTPAAAPGNFADGLEAQLNLRPAGIDPALRSSSSSTGFLPGATPLISTAQQKAAQDLATLESRYTPWLATGATGRSHSGTAGFDHLQVFEAEAESSTVLGSAARVTVITQPVLLQAGIPDLKSNYRFGSGGTAPTTSQFASGLGAELQLSGRSLQGAVGFSPTSFLVSNLVGSLALRPAQGPFTFRAYRTPIKDSMLSFAGMRDPATGQVWGGAVASGGTVEFDHGTGLSGFYASLDGQEITGKNIANNSRIMGNAGAYWLAYSNSFGQLKVGANVTAMHYAQNQRYFTLGQGGYFSPDGFLMVNAPVTWAGRPMHGTSYLVSGSLGAQNIQNGQAIAGSLVAGTGVETISSVSYDLHGRIVHRINEHWNLQGFLDTNNARQYADRSAGFSLMYMKVPQPAESVPGGLANQNDIRPLLRQ